MLMNGAAGCVQVACYRALLRLFGDEKSPECRYSLHYMVQVGGEFGIQTGQWYGPALVAQVLERLVNRHPMWAELEATGQVLDLGNASLTDTGESQEQKPPPSAESEIAGDGGNGADGGGGERDRMSESGVLIPPPSLYPTMGFITADGSRRAVG